jgi:excisionase family DNA binding protein
MAIREGYATVTEAARMLGVVRNTIRSWGAEGKIPEYRHPVNNYRLYKRTDLERLVCKLEQSVGARAAKPGRKKPR